MNTALKTGAAVTTTIALAVAAAFALSRANATAATAPGPQAVPVQVATVAQADVRAWDEFSGRLEAVERVDVRSRVAGTVHAVHFREGALVKQGELLITIDPAPYQAEVDRADAQVASAQARASYTKSEAERATRLLEERAIAGREHEERLNAHREAEANLRAAQASLQSARLNLGYTRVAAPVAGRVGKLEITAGNLVAAGPGAPVLTTLVSVNPIYASFEADERVLAKALQGLRSDGPGELAKIPVEMGTAATDDTPYRGKLQLVDNQVDAKSGTVRVRAVFDNRDGLLIPGQFARLRMAQARAFPAVLITERAVGTDQSKRFVMVVGEGNKADYREVKLGPSVDGLRVVTSGLKAEERIVVNGLQRVRPGTVVAPESVVMAKTLGDRPLSLVER